MGVNPLQVEYPIRIYPDICTDGSFCYVAEHPDLPGCGAHGTTVQEARELLAAARRAYIGHLLATGQTVPLPPPCGPVEWQSGAATVAVAARPDPRWRFTDADDPTI